VDFSFQPELILTFNMFFNLFSTVALAALLLSPLTSATQVDKRSVGALTPLSSKTKVCNILDYGGVADNSTDIGPAIKLAFSSCAISGGATIYIPPGYYSCTSSPSSHLNLY
jgi:rhamnogalacturonan hydrolase